MGSGPERALDFVNNVRDTADTLREKLGIPAYVVALDDNNRIYPDEICDPSPQNKDARKHLGRIRGLSGENALNPRPDEIMVSKNENSVFAVKGFAEHLKQASIDGVIIIGMDSSFCVAHSAQGAIQNELQCIVLTDLLAQSWRDHEGKNGGDPFWHEAAVRRGIDEATASKVRFASKKNFCDDPWKYLSMPEPTDIRVAAKPFSPKSTLIAER